MDYVPQNVGIYDTYYENFKESDCRACHGASTAERHHGTDYALSGNCQFCHSITMPLGPDGDSGWISGSSFSQVCIRGIDNHPWRNLSNVQNNDGAEAYCDIDDTDPTCYFDVKGFDISSIPDGAQVEGIQVYIKGKTNEPNWRGWDDVIELLKADTPVGNNDATKSRIWTMSWNTQYYGDARDYWGTSWTLADIKNPGFGLRLRFYNDEGETVRIEIDHVAIKVYYRLPQITNNCKVCHVDGGPIGNFGYPHHNSDLADSGKCNECHLHVVETNTVSPPDNEPSSVTPTPFSCENCHWPSGSVPHQAATYNGDTLNFLEDWQSWLGYPKPTTWPDGLAHPQSIEANGPVYSLGLGEKPYRPSDGTHHKIGGKVYDRCYYCHASTRVITPNWNPANPYLIRFCENCHDIATLHNIQEHVTDNNIYRIDGISNLLVTADEKCIGCHGESMLDLPPLSADIPEIDHLEPNFGPPGIIVNILPASGICFNEDPVNGLCSFGQKINGDGVIMGQKDTNGNWYWVDAPIHSWSEHLIQIKVPDRTFQPGKTTVKVHKEQVGTSALKVFIVLHNPVISSLTPSSCSWGQDVLVSGDGFCVNKEKIYENGYGYSAYIELYLLDDKYRVTMYHREEPWDLNKVFIRLADLLNINTGNPVLEQDLYQGCWNVKIIIDYFKDNPINGTPGKYNLNMGGLDPADELLYRVISNPVCLTITKDSYIKVVMPDRIPNAGTFDIDRVNPGSTQGMNYVLGGNDSALIETTDDEKDNEDGVAVNTKSGKEVELKIIQENKTEKKRVAMRELPAETQKPSKSELQEEIQKSLKGKYNNFLQGVTAQALTPELISRLNLPKKLKGVFVAEVGEDSPATMVIMQGDIIQKINLHEITSVKEYQKVAATIKPERDILLLIFRNSSFVYIILSGK
ncbi:MAG: hypothetical protein ABIB41_12635 [Nitrospirota bacterium]